MSITYSININSPIESSRKPDILSVLQSIPDNVQRIITPKDVRDAFLSTWANSSFKPTKIISSNIEYIGLDSGNSNNRDIKNKILLGKRNFGGVDIMTNSSLNSDTDIFIYNTKPDSDPNQSTKISILSGTGSSINSPFIKAEPSGNSFDLFIENPSGGDVNILSSSNSVFINGVAFPTVLENLNSANNDFILAYSGNYPFGKAVWKDPSTFSPNLTVIGNTGSETNIFGSPVKINGFSLEFVDNRLVPEKIGGVPQGFSFSANSFQGQDWPLSEVIRKIVYPYVEPDIKIEAKVIDNLFLRDFGDIGSNNDVSITYSITTFAREDSEFLFDIEVLRYSTQIRNLGTFTALPGSVTASSFIDNTTPPYNGNTIDYELRLKNTIDGSPITVFATYSLPLIKPILAMIDTRDENVNNNPSIIINDYITNPAAKTLLPQSNVVKIDNFVNNSNPQGYLYFACPFEYSILSGVRYNNQFIYETNQNFTYSISPIDAGQNYGSYRLYKLKNPLSGVPDTDIFELIFNTIFVPIPIQNPTDEWIFQPPLPPTTSIPVGNLNRYTNDGEIFGIERIPTYLLFNTLIPISASTPKRRSPNPDPNQQFNDDLPTPPPLGTDPAIPDWYRIEMSFLSSNGNNFQDVFNKIRRGSIFELIFGNDLIRYVVISFNIINAGSTNPYPTIIMFCSALFGSTATPLPITPGFPITFKLINY